MHRTTVQMIIQHELVMPEEVTTSQERIANKLCGSRTRIKPLVSSLNAEGNATLVQQ